MIFIFFLVHLAAGEGSIDPKDDAADDEAKKPGDKRPGGGGYEAVKEQTASGKVE